MNINLIACISATLRILILYAFSWVVLYLHVLHVNSQHILHTVPVQVLFTGFILLRQARLHRSIPHTFVIQNLGSMHQHFEFPWCYSAGRVLHAGQDWPCMMYCMVWKTASPIPSPSVSTWFCDFNYYSCSLSHLSFGRKVEYLSLPKISLTLCNFGGFFKWSKISQAGFETFPSFIMCTW